MARIHCLRALVKMAVRFHAFCRTHGLNGPSASEGFLGVLSFYAVDAGIIPRFRFNRRDRDRLRQSPEGFQKAFRRAYVNFFWPCNFAQYRPPRRLTGC